MSNFDFTSQSSCRKLFPLTFSPSVRIVVAEPIEDLPPSNLSWARLLKRVFNIDMETCQNYWGRVGIIAAIQVGIDAAQKREELGQLEYPGQIEHLPSETTSSLKISIVNSGLYNETDFPSQHPSSACIDPAGSLVANSSPYMNMKPPSNSENSLEQDPPELDVSLIEYNLSLSFEERLENHQRALDLLREILKARKELYGESESSPEATS